MSYRFVACGCLAILWLGSAAAAEPTIEITQWAWTNGIHDRQYEKRYGATAPLAPLYLWMRIRGGQAALDRLEADGRLPIYHQWFRDAIYGTSAEGASAMIDNIKLEAGRREILGSLQREVDRRGYFDWRTWSRKDNIRRGNWRVRVVYGDNRPVLCGGKPCEFVIHVR